MAEPVDLDLAKLQLRVDGTAQDDLITSYIVAARTFVEGQTGLVLVADDERVETFTGFSRELRLRSWPVREIVSVAYLDPAGADQVLLGTDWRFAGSVRPARLTVAAAGRWPRALCGPDAITITFKAGFATADKVPQDIKQAILLLIRHWFENPSAVLSGNAAAAVEVPFGVDLILDRYRVGRV